MDAVNLHPVYGAKLSPEQFKAMSEDERYAAICNASRAAVKLFRDTTDRQASLSIYWSIRDAQEEPACSWERYWTYAVITQPMTDAEIDATQKQQIC